MEQFRTVVADRDKEHLAYVEGTFPTSTERTPELEREVLVQFILDLKFMKGTPRISAKKWLV
jgi:hypothetical protein